MHKCNRKNHNREKCLICRMVDIEYNVVDRTTEEYKANRKISLKNNRDFYNKFVKKFLKGK